jgi:integrase
MTDEKPDKRKPEPRRPGGKTKSGPNKWLLRIFRGYDSQGRRIYYSETFLGGSREADDRLVELRNRHKTGLPLKFQPKTFKDFFEEWIEDRDNGKRRECTIDQYRMMGRVYLLPAFGKFALTDVTDVAVKRFYKDMRKRKLSPYTIHNVHVLLANIFKMAAKRGLVLADPMTALEADDKPPSPKPKPVAMTADETQQFLDAAAARSEGFMFRLAYFLGARPCEYLGLQWSDVDFKNRRVTIQRSLKLRIGGEWYVTPPKTEKSIRTIPLTPAFVKDLQDHRRRQLEMKLKAGRGWGDHEFIFTVELGEPLKMYVVRAVHKRICEAAGLSAAFKLKVSRHSCASALLNDGVPIKMVSDRLGHSSIQITGDVYGVTDEDRQREVSERLERLFGSGEK